jgi:hypothetical protein
MGQIVVTRRVTLRPITGQTALERRQSWRRILLLVIAIVIHNFPEGLAVGVRFGALATVKTHEPASTSEVDILAAQKLTDDKYNSVFDSAKTLAIGIGLQNFSEGLAVSLPLMRVGYNRTRLLVGSTEPHGRADRRRTGVITYMKPGTRMPDRSRVLLALLLLFCWSAVPVAAQPPLGDFFEQILTLPPVMIGGG